eukprot:54361_1
MGGDDVLNDHKFWKTHAITHVISVGSTRPSADMTRQMHLEVTHIQKSDLPHVSLWKELGRSAEIIHRARLGGGAIYVHCQAGISRSSTLTLAYVMSYLGMTFLEAAAFLERRRGCARPNPGFQAQLIEFGKCGKSAEIGHKLRR